MLRGSTALLGERPIELAVRVSLREGGAVFLLYPASGTKGASFPFIDEVSFAKAAAFTSFESASCAKGAPFSASMALPA